MFDRLQTRLALTIGVFLIQQFLAIASSFFLALMTTRISNHVYVEFAGWTLGALPGFIVGKIFPRFTKEGRLVWILPLLLFVIALLYDLQMHSWMSVLNDYVWLLPHDRDSRVGHTLVTFPAWGCYCYSLGMLFASQNAEVRAPEMDPVEPHVHS